MSQPLRALASRLAVWLPINSLRGSGVDQDERSDAPRQISRSPIFARVGQFRNPSYGIPLTSRPDGKLVVFGLPKSGNVWLVSMLADYFEMRPIDPYVSADQTGIGMCHLPFSEALGERLDFLHGVYLLRDLRDVITSYFHHVQREDFRTDVPNCECATVEEFYYEWFLPRVVPFHGLQDHAEKYAELGVPIIRYEKLWDNPDRELHRLLRRLGLPINSERISAAVQKNRLEELQKTGRQLDIYVPSAHFRRGGYGGYKSELPQSVIRHINRTFGELLLRWGYEI